MEIRTCGQMVLYSGSIPECPIKQEVLMNNREYLKLKKWKLCWPGKKQGRYWKRRLSKARRKYYKALLRGDLHPKEPTYYESICNYKTY